MRVAPRVGTAALAVVVTIVATGATASPAPTTVPTAPSAAHAGAARPAPPQVDTGPRRWKRLSLDITTTVDTDRNGRPDTVHAQLVRPPAWDVGGQPLATVIVASPYNNCCGTARNHDVDVPLYVPGEQRPRPDDYADWLASQWVPHGYALMTVDSLGSAGSTGCPTVGDAAEAAGPAAAVDWLNGRAAATRPDGTPATAPWASGRVGMTGVSYDGTLPNMAAATGVEGLEAIVATSAISSWYDYYRAGGHVVAPGGFQGEDVDVLARFDYTRHNRQICKPVIHDLAVGQDRVTGDYSPFWADRDLLPLADRVTAAVLIAHGFGDDNVRPSQAAQWYAALRAAGAAAALYWTPGGHGAGAPLALERRWFDHYLYDVPNGIDTGDRVWIRGRGGAVRRYADWPASSAAATSFALRARRGDATTGRLVEGGAASFVTEVFTDVPSLTPLDLASRPRPTRGLVYRTPPLATGLRLSGTPQVALGLSFSRPAANVTAALVRWSASGRLSVLGTGWTDPQNRTSLSVTEPVTPGTTYDLVVHLQPQDLLLDRGDRLGLVVMATDHDHTLRPPRGTVVTLDLSRATLTLPLAPR